jgi:hypothetical protein
MEGRFERFDMRSGGSYRLVLTYTDCSGAGGKTGAGSDVVEARVIEVLDSVRVVQQIDVESGDPVYTGTMTMTWSLTPTDTGVRVEILADDVPEGISAVPLRPAAEGQKRRTRGTGRRTNHRSHLAPAPAEEPIHHPPRRASAGAALRHPCPVHQWRCRRPSRVLLSATVVRRRLPDPARPPSPSPTTPARRPGAPSPAPRTNHPISGRPMISGVLAGRTG